MEERKEQDLMTRDAFGNVVPICSSGVRVCITCGVPLTDENDSGWEKFLPGGQLTQGVCKTCDEKDACVGSKMLDPEDLN